MVPYAGGTSVVGGLAPRASGSSRSTSPAQPADRQLDEISRTATLEAGVRGPAAEALLAEHGYTLGHFPQSYEGASIGGYAATRSSGQSSAGYGRFDQMVVGLTLATPRGTIELGRAPMSAAGPDLRQLVLGSEGAFGIITSVVLRIRPRPAERSFEGWQFASFDEGLTAIRRLAQDGPLPTVLRLSDEAETAVNLADPDVLGGDGTGGVLAIVGFEGTRTAVRRAEVAEVLTAAGGESLGEGPGETWRQGRYRAPYLRDPLLDEGALVETLETAGVLVGPARAEGEGHRGTGRCRCPSRARHHWCSVTSRTSTRPAPPCTSRSSPLRPTIPSLNGGRRRRPRVRRSRRPAARSRITTVSAPTIASAYAAEIGPLAVESLQAVKHVLDPNGILNPGILLR